MFGRFNLQQMFISLLMLVTIMPIHECAHAWVAYKLGDGSAKYNGRMTLNPMAHLDLWGTVAFLVVGIGWGKPVPVYGRNLRHPKRDMALVALAGPVSNLLLSTLLVIFYKLLIVFFRPAGVLAVVVQLLAMLAQTSVYWAVFNLLPVPPLDGSRLLEYIVPAKVYWKIEQYQRYIYIGMLVLLLTGILSVPISWVSGYLMDFINFITRPINLLGNLL